jgi:predicted ATPase
MAGDNGSGKSTILEAIAAALGFAEQGGEFDRLGELPAVPGNVLDDARTPLLAPVPERHQAAKRPLPAS